jgi:septal ring factor EnvC (AmiA/AmiB activator)
MKTRLLLAAAALAATATGCASRTTALDRHFLAGDLAGVTRAFEADSSLHRRPDALFRAGVAYALPRSPVHDPQRARALLERLQQEHPRAPQRHEAAQLLQFVELVGLQDERQLSRDARLRAQQTEIDDLRAQIARERARADRLDRDLREREARLRALEAELAALKRIDLNRPPAGAAPAAERPRPPQP